MCVRLQALACWLRVDAGGQADGLAGGLAGGLGPLRVCGSQGWWTRSGSSPPALKLSRLVDSAARAAATLKGTALKGT
jgi:hypothetical protein